MRDPRDYKVELTSGATGRTNVTGADASGKRPFISVRFACCNVYVRIYRSTDGSSYSGRCPKCGKPVRFVVGAGGTSERFFVVH